MAGDGHCPSHDSMYYAHMFFIVVHGALAVWFAVQYWKSTRLMLAKDPSALWKDEIHFADRYILNIQSIFFRFNAMLLVLEAMEIQGVLLIEGPDHECLDLTVWIGRFFSGLMMIQIVLMLITVNSHTFSNIAFAYCLALACDLCTEITTKLWLKLLMTCIAVPLTLVPFMFIFSFYSSKVFFERVKKLIRDLTLLVFLFVVLDISEFIFGAIIIDEDPVTGTIRPKMDLCTHFITRVLFNFMFLYHDSKLRPKLLTRFSVHAQGSGEAKANVASNNNRSVTNKVNSPGYGEDLNALESSNNAKPQQPEVFFVVPDSGGRQTQPEDNL